MSRETADKTARQHRADPEDPGARYTATARRARVEGPGVWLEPLDTLEAWAAQPDEAQDQAAEEVARRLGSGWALRGVRERWCRNGPGESDECDECEGGQIFSDDDSPCKGCDGTGRRIYYDSIIHRLALFEHRATGAEFSLVPGDSTPWLRYNGIGLPGAYCCRRAAGDFCWEHTPGNGIVIRPLLVARWPVTWAQQASPRHPFGAGPKPSDSDDLPATGFTHRACAEWCGAIGMRLPTATEWSHAARGGAPTRFPWGDEVDDSFVWHAGNSMAGCSWCGGKDFPSHAACCMGAEARGERAPRPHPPAEHDAAGKWNAFGLVDCVGNVMEWTADHAQRGPEPDQPGNGHLAMGGGYATPRAAIGERHRGVGSTGWIGFRPVCDVPMEAE